MIRLLLCAVAAGLCGCGTMNASVIRSDALAFQDAMEDATNKLLVLNVLRARDKAPLHFADIPAIRESLSQNASLTAPGFLSNLLAFRKSASATAGMAVSPSFELSHLASREFHTGISSPIEARVVKYWLDRGLDRRIVLLLFFSSMEIVETRADGTSVIRIMNSPREALEAIRERRAWATAEPQRCDTQSDFERYLKLINALKTFFGNVYRERRLLGAPFSLETEKDPKGLLPFAALDASKTQLVFDRGTGKYSLYALGAEQKVAFCMGESGGAVAAVATSADASAGRDACLGSLVEAPSEDSRRPRSPETALRFPGEQARAEPSRYCSIFNRFVGIDAPEASTRLQLRLNTRSVGEIFQFLGDLLHYQDELRRLYAATSDKPRLNTPVTFGYCPADASPGCGDVFIRLDAPSCNARFSLDYRGAQYVVGNYGRGSPDCDPGAGADHTLEILSILHQLVGLNRSGAELRQTPAVQVVP
jgi:hypothetical protein